MATDTRRELQIVIEAVDNASKQLKQITENMGDLESTTQKSISSTSDMTKAVAKGNLIYDITSTIIKKAASGFKDLITQSTIASGQLKQNQAVIMGLAENVGWTRDNVLSLVSAIREEGKDLLTATEITKTAISANLEMAQAQEIVARGRDVAAASNRNSNDAIRGMIQAIATLKPGLVENYGLMISERIAYSEFAESVGKSTSQLSKVERQQALYNAIMDQAKEKQGAYEDAMGSWLKKANSVKDLMDETKMVLGGLMDAGLKPIINIVYTALKAFNQWAMDSEGNLNPALQGIRQIIGVLALTIFKVGQQMFLLAREVLAPLADAFKLAGGNANTFSTYIIVTGRVVSTAITIFRFFIKTIANFGAMMIEAGGVAVGIAKDIFGAYKNLFSNLKSGFSAVAKFMVGDFDGAKEEMTKAMSSVFENTISSFQQFSSTSEAITNQMESDFYDLGDSVDKLWDFDAMQAEIDMMAEAGSGFADSLTNDFGLISSASSDMADSSSGDAKEMTSAWEKFGTSVSKIADNMASKFEESQEKIRDLISETTSLNVEKAKDELSFRQGIAEAYVDQEETVADLRADWQSEGTQNTKDELLNELKIQEEALAERKHLEASFSNEIAEERRKRSLTEFERELEDLDRSRQVMEEEYQTKILAIKNELSAELEKQAKLEQIQEYASLKLKEFLLNNEKATVNSINNEIEKYNQLATAISKARAGQASRTLGTGEITSGLATLGIQQGQLAPISLTITGNSFLDENASVQMGDQLMDILKSNIRI